MPAVTVHACGAQEKERPDRVEIVRVAAPHAVHGNSSGTSFMPTLVGTYRL